MKKEKYEIYETENYNNIREVLDNAFANYPDNIAFRLKEEQDKKIIYKDITYKQFQEEINELGTELISIGLKDKRIAIISKNRYEWL